MFVRSDSSTNTNDVVGDGLSEMSRKNSIHIQFLRAFAVTWVIVDHAFPTMLPGGFVGVDIFFVISGFLISQHLYVQIYSGEFSFCLVLFKSMPSKFNLK